MSSFGSGGPTTTPANDGDDDSNDDVAFGGAVEAAPLRGAPSRMQEISRVARQRRKNQRNDNGSSWLTGFIGIVCPTLCIVIIGLVCCVCIVGLVIMVVPTPRAVKKRLSRNILVKADLTTTTPEKAFAPTPQLSPAHDHNLGARKNAFDHIYATNVWGGAGDIANHLAGKQTLSGGGSWQHVTVSVRQCISKWLVKYEIKSLLDVPCGDVNWQHLIPELGGPGSHTVYVGGDISNIALRRARMRTEASVKGFRFKWFDSVTSKYTIDPTGPVGPPPDAVMFRDFIQHIAVADGKRAMEKARLDGVQYLLVSTFPQVGANVVRPGQVAKSFKNNVRLAPYNLMNPLEDCVNHDGEFKSGGSRMQLFRLNTASEAAAIVKAAAAEEKRKAAKVAAPRAAAAVNESAK